MLPSPATFGLARAETRSSGLSSALFGRLEAAALLEQAGVCVKDCPAALHAAVRGEHVDMCEWLLDRGISVEARDEDDCTPLETAICHNSLQAAECLLQRGANPVAPTSLRQVPLAFAVEMGNLPMVELMLRHGTDINAVPYEGGSTALMVAAKEDNADMVRFLLEHGADTEVADADEWTAFSMPKARLLPACSCNTVPIPMHGISPTGLHCKRRSSLTRTMPWWPCWKPRRRAGETSRGAAGLPAPPGPRGGGGNGAAGWCAPVPAG